MTATTHAIFHSIAMGAVYTPVTCTYNAGAPAYYSIPFTGTARKVGASYRGNNNNTTAYYHPAAGSGCRGFMFADFIKAAPDINGAFYMHTTAAQAQTNWTMDDLYLGTQQARAGALNLRGTSITASAGTHNLTAVNESAGVLDTFNLFWNNAAVPFECYGMVIYATGIS